MGSGSWSLAQSRWEREPVAEKPAGAPAAASSRRAERPPPPPGGAFSGPPPGARARPRGRRQGDGASHVTPERSAGPRRAVSEPAALRPAPPLAGKRSRADDVTGRGRPGRRGLPRWRKRSCYGSRSASCRVSRAGLWSRPLSVPSPHGGRSPPAVSPARSGAKVGRARQEVGTRRGFRA